MKVATFRNNENKYWFPHETKLVFVHGHVCKDRSKNCAIFKIKPFSWIENNRVYNKVYVTAVTQPSSQAKLKSDEGGIR